MSDFTHRTKAKFNYTIPVLVGDKTTNYPSSGFRLAITTGYSGRILDPDPQYGLCHGDGSVVVQIDTCLNVFQLSIDQISEFHSSTACDTE